MLKHAELLLKLADKIDKAIDESVLFECDDCGLIHPLGVINTENKKASEEAGVEYEPVTVNDKIECPDCGGTMAWSPDEQSEQFFEESTEGSEEDLPSPESLSDILGGAGVKPAPEVEEKDAAGALRMQPDYGENQASAEYKPLGMETVEPSSDDSIPNPRKDKLHRYLSFGKQ